MNWGMFLNFFSIVVAIAAAAAIAVPFKFICSDAEFVCVLHVLNKFQTLITGMIAGLAALIAAWVVYRAAKKTIDFEKNRLDDERKSRKIVGAAILQCAMNEFILCLEDLGKDFRYLDKYRVPSALLDFDLITTQDADSAANIAGGVNAANIVLSVCQNPQQFPNENVSELYISLINDLRKTAAKLSYISRDIDESS